MSKVEYGENAKFGYQVSIDRDCYHSESSDEEWGSWSRSYRNTFQSIKKGGEFPDVVSTHNLKTGEKCFVVWVEYSTGDSFGSAERAEVEVVGVFKDRAVAEELRLALIYYDKHKPNQQWDDRYTFHFKTSDGQEFNYGFVPWSGYFEYLDEAHIKETVILE